MIDAGARAAHRDLRDHLRPFVARRVPDSDVDDVVQDVFVRLQRGVSDLRDDARFGPWIYQVARSAIAEHRRTRARHPLAEGEPPDIEAEADPEDPESAAAASLAAYTASLVASLPEPYREALTLTELRGLTQREAAEMLGISLSGMKSRVQRGRDRLRQLVEACCEIALDARGHVIGCEPRDRPCRC